MFNEEIMQQISNIGGYSSMSIIATRPMQPYIHTLYIKDRAHPCFIPKCNSRGRLSF